MFSGWWLVIGRQDTGELLAVKRITGARKHITADLSFALPNQKSGRGNARAVTLYLMSDTYIGLDQQYEISLPSAAKVSKPVHAKVDVSKDAEKKTEEKEKEDKEAEEGKESVEVAAEEQEEESFWG